MDYKSLLSLADKNQELKDNEFVIKRKAKDGHNSGPNKSAVEAFKARKQREEMEKQRERQREKDRLLSLRAQNSKSVKKALMMKTRTKDNDFSRIVLTDAQIEEQKRVEEKLKRKGTQDLDQNKRSRNDVEDKFIKNSAKNLNNQPKNGLKSDKSIDNKTKNNDKNSNNNKNSENRVKPRSAAPALNYEQLLSLATEKSKSEKKTLAEELMSEIEVKKQMRPMTQKEKDRLREEWYYKSRANKGLPKLPNPEDIRKRDIKRDSNSGRKANNYETNRNNNNNNNYNKLQNNQKSVSHSNQTQLKSDKNIKNTNNYNNVSERSDRYVDKPTNVRQRVPQNRPQVSASVASSSGVNKSAIMAKMADRLNTRDREYNERYQSASKDKNKITNNEINRNKSINARARPPSPSPPPIREPMPKLPPIGSTYRRGMYENVAEYMDNDYEEEEDDDMSDFIDDGPEEKPIEEDYSRAIREIFGYDKRKFRNIDDDDIEEANFSQCMKEEVRSARIGLQEDLEEERKEKEAERLKLLAKKRFNR